MATLSDPLNTVQSDTVVFACQWSVEEYDIIMVPSDDNKGIGGDELDFSVFDRYNHRKTKHTFFF